MAHAAQAFAGLDAEYYDSILGPAQLEAIASELVGRVPSKPDGDVLELACGTGIVTRKLREQLDPAVRLVATDLSPAMIDYARKKLREQEGIEWREADMASLPFPDASFGAVVCSLGIMFVPDKKKAFAEARRVLREGGTFLFNTWDSLHENPHARTAGEVMDELFPGDPEMQFAKIPFGFYDYAVIRKHLAEHGLRELRMEKRPIAIHCETVHRYATGMVKGTPRALLIRERGKSLDEVIDKLAAALARVGGDAPFRLPAQVIVVETRAG
jgi:ubiquinone/menaquinone biosynthesis C-methylase UbiE